MPLNIILYPFKNQQIIIFSDAKRKGRPVLETRTACLKITKAFSQINNGDLKFVMLKNVIFGIIVYSTNNKEKSGSLK
jgi:hypothetical protein